MEAERLIEGRIEQMIATRPASRYFHALAEAALEPADPLSVGDR